MFSPTCPGSSPGVSSSGGRGSSSGSPCRASSHCPGRQSSSSPAVKCSPPAQRRLCLLRAPSTTLSRLTGSRARTVPELPSRWSPWCRRNKRLTNSRTGLRDSAPGKFLSPHPAVSCSVSGWTRSKMPDLPQPWGRCGLKRTVGDSVSLWNSASRWDWNIKASRGLRWGGTVSTQHTCTGAAILFLRHHRCWAQGLITAP